MATDCSGVKELLGENGEYGIIMEVNEEDIYLKMKNVIKNSETTEYYKKKIMERKKIISYKRRIELIEELL